MMGPNEMECSTVPICSDDGTTSEFPRFLPHTHTPNVRRPFDQVVVVTIVAVAEGNMNL